MKQSFAIGTTERLALGILLYTGQRRSDVVRFCPAIVKNDWLVFTQHKNRNRKPVEMARPFVEPLKKLIEQTPARERKHGLFRQQTSRLKGTIFRVGLRMVVRKRACQAHLTVCGRLPHQGSLSSAVRSVKLWLLGATLLRRKSTDMLSPLAKKSLRSRQWTRCLSPICNSFRTVSSEAFGPHQPKRAAQVR